MYLVYLLIKLDHRLSLPASLQDDHHPPEMELTMSWFLKR
jgi:hypothetical protein